MTQALEAIAMRSNQVTSVVMGVATRWLDGTCLCRQCTPLQRVLVLCLTRQASVMFDTTRILPFDLA